MAELFRFSRENREEEEEVKGWRKIAKFSKKCEVTLKEGITNSK